MKKMSLLVIMVSVAVAISFATQDALTGDLPDPVNLSPQQTRWRASWAGEKLATGGAAMGPDAVTLRASFSPAWARSLDKIAQRSSNLMALDRLIQDTTPPGLGSLANSANDLNGRGFPHFHGF